MTMTRRLGALLMMAGLMLALCVQAADEEKQRQYDYFFLEAVCQRQAGHNDAAFDLFSHCIRLDPSRSEAYYYLAQYYSALKNREKAQVYFKKAADLNPDNSTYLETLAQSYINNQESANAIATLERLYEKNRDREDILGMLVQLYRQGKDYPNAIKTLDRLEQLEGKSERLSYAKANMYSEQGDKKAAIAEMKKLADQYPNDLNYRGLYADMLLMNEQEKEAFAIYTDILKEEPGNNHAQLSLRSYYLQQNDTAMADTITMKLLLNKNASSADKIYIMRQEIGESERLGGDSTKVLGMFRRILGQPQTDADMGILCATYMSLKNMPHDSISPVLMQVLTAAPDNAAARLQLVSYAWEKQDMDRIIELCKAARQYNPDEMAFYYYQGMAYFRKDDTDNALGAFQNGIDVINAQSDPGIVSDFYAVMGDLLYQKGRQQEAFAAYDSCLQWKEDNLSCMNNYAYYLSELGKQLDKAEQMAYKVIKAEPENATYLDTYAWILFKQKRYAEAKIYIDQTLQCDSDSSAVMLEHAGDIYAMSGDVPRALALWTEALKKAPGNKVLIRKIKLKKYLKE